MSDTPTPALAPEELVGRVSTTTGIAADISGGISGALVGRVSSSTFVWGEATPAVLLELANSIIVTTIRASSYLIEPFSGRINTTSSAVGVTGSGLAVLTGTISTTGSATGLATETNFSGRIGTTAAATVNFRDPQIFVGNIQTATNALLVSIPLSELPAVTIFTASGATLAPEMLAVGTIKSTSGARLDIAEFHVFLQGIISSTTTAFFTPTEAVLSGHIQTAVYAYLPPLPILPQVEPPYCPAPAELGDYIDLITSEHKPRPNYIASVTASIEPLVEDQSLTASMPCLFDVDMAVGEQEDFVGQWIGKTRYVHLGNVFFSWDTKGLGYDEANWRGPYDPENAIATLDDYHYRLLLYAAIVANSWDGSIPEAYRAWDILFAGTGYRVLIQDNGNMTMMLGLMGTGGIDAVTAALFQNGDMDLRPEGISLIDYVFQAQPNVPFFAWDSVSDSVAGWDLGYWGYLVPPGQGFVPESARMRG